MSEYELTEVELRLERGAFTGDDIRRLIQAVRELRNKLEGIEAVIGNTFGKRRSD